MKQEELKSFLLSLTSNRELKITKYPLQVRYLILLTSFLPDNTKLTQRSWHVLNDCYYKITCRECEKYVSWFIRKKRYYTYCSNSCVNKSTNVKNNRKKTTFKNYGVDVPAKNKDIKHKMQQTLYNNYGVIYPLQNAQIKQKAIDTWVSKYNRTHPSLINISNKVLSFLQNKQWLITQHHVNKKTLTQISIEYLNNIDISALSRHMVLHDIPILNHTNSSFGERQLCEHLSQIYDGTIHANTRNIIPPYELDIYIPEHKLAIEYCGLYWHSEQQGKDKHYHKRKYDLCKEKGIQLLTIFEDEWDFNKMLCKNKIHHILNIIENKKIYARKCKIVLTSVLDKQKFFNDNHIQGNGPGSINIGLEYEGTLVACMSFIKQQKQHYLNRYATSCNIPGGFSKLLKYFQNNYEWNKLISFADCRWSNGNLYEKTGWKLDSILPPDYSYIESGLRKHKFGFRHKFLEKKLQNYNPKLTEKQNCDNNGLLRIWDCGKLRFVLTREQQI